MDNTGTDARLTGPLRGASDYFRHLLRINRSALTSALLSSLLIQLLGISLAIFSMQVIDRIIPQQASDTLLVLGGGLIAALLAQAALKVVRARVFDRIGLQLDLSMSQRIFNRTLTSRLSTRNTTVGTLASRISELDAVTRLLSAQSLFSLTDLPAIVLLVAVTAIVGGSLAWIPASAVPLLLLAHWLGRKRLQTAAEAELRASNSRHGMLVEVIDGAETIHAWRAEGWFSRRWYNASLQVGSLSAATRLAGAQRSIVDDALRQGLFALTLVMGALLVSQGKLSIGGLVAAALLIDLSLQPLSRLGQMTADWARARQALKDLDAFLLSDDVAGDEVTNTAVAQNRIRLEQFSPDILLENAVLKVGEEQITAISVPRLEIKAGEKIAIVGPTGSGKTSLLRLLTGLYQPDEGRCYVSGVDLQLHDPQILRRQIGYLPQNPSLFNSTLKDNLSAGLTYPGDNRMLEILKLVGLDNLVNQHPRGLNLMIAEGGNGLSGGQSKLVGLARVLAQDASVLLLDEPTGSLDPQSEPRLIVRLKSFFKPDQTVIYVTHKLNLLTIVDRIIVVDQGKIIMDGPREEILAKIRPGQTRSPAPSKAAAPAKAAESTVARKD